MRTKTLSIAALLLALLMMAGETRARIKLAALPERERVEIQLDNGNFTLVEEERIVPLLKSTAEMGNNMIDFSWSNATVDKDSIQFRPISISEDGKFRPLKKLSVGGKEVPEVSVINVSYPPGENALVWEVYAHEACAVKVRVSYLISNLTRSFSYRAAADKDEKFLQLKHYLKIRNYSGEDFGTSSVWAGFGEVYEKLVENQFDIKMLVTRFDQVPIEKTYTFDWYTNGALNAEKPFASKVLMHYKLMNDKANKLGEYPLPPGKVRIFIADGQGGEAFLGEDWAKLTPIDSEMRLYLGEARDVICTRTIEKNERTEISGNLHNQEILIKYEIENFKDKPVTLDIVEQVNRIASEYAGSPHGDAEWEKGKETSKEFDIDMEKGGATPTLKVDIDARPKDPSKPVEKKTFFFHVHVKNVW